MEVNHTVDKQPRGAGRGVQKKSKAQSIKEIARVFYLPFQSETDSDLSRVNGVSVYSSWGQE